MKRTASARRNSSASGTSTRRKAAARPTFAVCVRNDGYEASLERNKIYAILPDDEAERDGDLRVVDESGEDYTRLSNGFSRKIENHIAAVAINYFAYNFIKIHSTLRMSPAMAAGVTDRLFDVMDLVNLLAESEKKAA
jgi:hypothetical protein